MTTPAQEIVVFISYENQRSPEEIARELIAVVPAGRATLGVDLLTGGTEVRFYYDPVVLSVIQNFLAENAILHELTLI